METRKRRNPRTGAKLRHEGASGSEARSGTRANSRAAAGLELNQDLVMRIVKVGLVLLLLIYLIVIYRGDGARDCSIEEITAEMEQDSDLTALQKKSGIDLKRYIGIDEASYDGFLFYKAESPMAVEELLIVKVKEQSQLSDLQESLEEHVENQKKSFEGYGAEQTALLNEAIIDTRGNFAFLAVGEKADAWKTRYVDFIK
ncbi:MAG TPA: DUF4358 domain-containing protein [Candidatus Egerieimonas intestinavium]|uniref:DUF4358 domain-containing protein n=1 Tax=Candidatus Egerieimonas intestinavium TaxID=2840777 RepID=A0A9D1JER2_9FIRM|nr:DUF4358 domain-containing protein [Candidatus Egerieimonas intestinavium]